MQTETASEPTDAEEFALEVALSAKALTIQSLVEAATARKARGDDTTELEAGIDHENEVRAGYQRALEKRRKEIRLFPTRGKR